MAARNDDSRAIRVLRSCRLPVRDGWRWRVARFSPRSRANDLSLTFHGSSPAYCSVIARPACVIASSRKRTLASPAGEFPLESCPGCRGCLTGRAVRAATCSDRVSLRRPSPPAPRPLPDTPMRVLAHALPCVCTHVSCMWRKRKRKGKREAKRRTDSQREGEGERGTYGSAAGQRGHKSILMG